jgi:hypothetical protein
MNLLRIISQPVAWASGWTSAILCFSAASGFWLAGQQRRAVIWLVLGAFEIAAVVV